MQKRHGNEVLEHYEGACGSPTSARTARPIQMAFARAMTWSGCTNGHGQSGKRRLGAGPSELREFNPVKFWVLREGKTLFGHLPVTSSAR
ncbi:MAG: hypothetical protein CM1200mP2_58100 [Planctomycetaceae bacterium]|nr:MAG: hypothetical protein CM1200mP2_58100 [Planctomycetaceae bacterium]